MLENPWWKQSYGNRSDGENTKLLTLSLLKVERQKRLQVVGMDEWWRRGGALWEGRGEKIIYIFIKKKRISPSQS